MPNYFRRIATGLLATAAVAAGLAFSDIKQPRRYFATDHTEAATPSVKYQDELPKIEKPNRKYQDDTPEAERPTENPPKERQLSFPSNKLKELYRVPFSLDLVSAPSGKRENPITNALTTYAAYWLGENITTLNHEGNGHGRVFEEFHVPYEVEVNIGPFGSSGATRNLKKVPGKLDDQSRMGGVWGSKNLYRKLHDYTIEEDLDGSGFSGKLAHWTAFWAGTDFMSYYGVDRQDAQG